MNIASLYTAALLQRFHCKGSQLGYGIMRITGVQETLPHGSPEVGNFVVVLRDCQARIRLQGLLTLLVGDFVSHIDYHVFLPANHATPAKFLKNISGVHAVCGGGLAGMQQEA